MIMALLEWFLWLAAFVYCLYKAFRKAEHWSINVLCVVVGILFVAFRLVCPLVHISRVETESR